MCTVRSHTRSLPEPFNRGIKATVNSRSPQLASASGDLPSAVRWAHLLIADRLQDGEAAIDATCGNGHDSLMLAQILGPQGRLWAVDVQPAAVAATNLRLQGLGGLAPQLQVLEGNHRDLEILIDPQWHGQIAVIMFNLGYLPGSDKSVTTQEADTLPALEAALRLLRPRGLLTLAVYPGHAQGKLEQARINEWARQLDPRRFEVQLLRPINRLADPPECWVIWKQPAATAPSV